MHMSTQANLSNGSNTNNTNNSESDKLLLTVGEVAHRLSLSKAKIYTMAHSSEIASVRMGRSVRIPAAALDAFLSSHAV
jgi:excisionase family DNA binding protein